ncbi:uncharacterized protein LOC142342940 [Convolutriloba macropyga]|uniref:uncharacterized protein LOC142342940 n=1 Tax=Convolutriloba macropyga TaxID=536237 RepID=UPI003F520142
MECKMRGWCKSFNHNQDWATCELFMTDYRLLEIPRVSNIQSIGWRHYSKVDFVRGCVGESARDCVQLWVDTTKTSNVSITCQWTLADGEETSFLAEQGRRAFELTAQNVEHLDQQGMSITAKKIVHNLSPKIRELDVPDADIPGVEYTFQLNQIFCGVPAQFPLLTSESTYPSGLVELSHLRVVTEHSIDIHFTFHGTAAVLDVWTVPSEGSCPCTLDPIGLEVVQVRGLTAGQDYKLFMQLTSAYGKKGPITSFEQATYTDELTEGL